MRSKILVLSLSLMVFNTANAYESHNENKKYCEQSGGIVEWMPAQFLTSQGIVEGHIRKFCTFRIDNGFLAIGLRTFSSMKPSIAATFIKKLNPILPDSHLLAGPYQTNPSIQVCKNLGGASITAITDGGFANSLGQTDICVFGDGSMVSGWTLIYIANNRDGYNDVKDKIRAEPLDIPIPQ